VPPSTSASLDPSIIADVTGGLERAYESGRQQGQREAQQQFFGGAAMVLTSRLFAAALGEAAASLREYSPDGAAFFSEQAALFEEFITPPQVQVHDPADGAANVSPDAVVNVRFANPIRPETLTDDTFYVGADTGGPHLTGNIVYDEHTQTATFAPASALTPGVTYRVTLHGVRAEGGMPLDPAVTFTFTTGSG
jgi:hypothetical protein